MESNLKTNLEQNPAQTLNAMVLTAIGLFIGGLLALWSGFTLVQNLTTNPALLLGLGTVMVLFTGLLVYVIFPAGALWKSRLQVKVLFILCLINYFIISGTILLGIQGDVVALSVLMAGLSGIICIATLFSRTYIGSCTGIALSRNSTTTAALIVATVTQCAGIAGLWSLWGVQMVFFGLFVSLFMGGVIVFLALLITTLITTSLVLLKGLKMFSEIVSD